MVVENTNNESNSDKQSVSNTTTLPEEIKENNDSKFDEDLKKIINKKSNSSEESEENARQKEDRRVYYNIYGNYIGNDAKILGGVNSHNLKSEKYEEENVFSMSISNTEIKRISSIYLKPSQYDNGVNIVSKNHLLFMCGNLHTGKYASSIHMLLNFTSKVIDLFPNVNLDEFQFAEKEGYIFECTDKERLMYWLDKNRFLGQKLKNKSSYLIVRFNGQVQQKISEINQLIIDWQEKPLLIQALESHLSYYLINNQVHLDEKMAILKQPSIQDLLQQDLSLSTISNLAEEIASVSQDDYLKLEKIIEKFSHPFSIDRKVEEWFNEHKELNQHLLMVTLSVFSGCEYQIIKERNNELQLLVDELFSDESSKKTSLTQLSIKFSDLLKDMNAHIEKNGKNTYYGNVPTDLVLLDDPTYQPSILLHVWQEYYEYRQFILTWLKNSGFHSNVYIRSCASKAVATLSKYAFSEIEENIIRPWVNSLDTKSQWLAGYTVSCATFDKSDFTTKKLVHSWSKSSNQKFQYAAIAAYSGTLGQMHPTSSLTDLLTIWEDSGLVMTREIIDSIIEIFRFGELVPVLNTLKKWTEKISRKGKITSDLLAILTLLDLMEMKMSLYDMQHNNPPTLLWLSGKDEVYKNLIIDLLRKSLNSHVFQKHIFERIFSWFKSLDDNLESDLFATMGSIIYNLCIGSEREKERMFRKLNLWSVKQESRSTNHIFTIIKENI